MTTSNPQPLVPPPDLIKVYCVSTSLAHSRRGIESFFRECFDAMHGYPGLQMELFKGSGEDAADEHRLPCLINTKWPARLIGKLVHRTPQTIEQLSAYPSLARSIRRGKPDIIFYSDMNLAMQLHKRRHKIGVPFRMLFSNGAPIPPPFDQTDHVQQVTPTYYHMAITAGEPPEKHTMLPYGIHVPAGDLIWDANQRRAIRHELRLPLDRPIVLSVGWIASQLKRMDYLIDEIASLPHPRPFVVMLGEIDDKSPPIIAAAEEKLGYGNFAIRSVPYQDVNRYYACADIFTLASLKEGFGRVFLEALIHGLPCVVNDHPIMRYVLGEEGYFADLSQIGQLARQIQVQLQIPADVVAMARRREHVRKNFSWDVLRPAYFQMFRDCLGKTACPALAAETEASITEPAEPLVPSSENDDPKADTTSEASSIDAAAPTDKITDSATPIDGPPANEPTSA